MASRESPLRHVATGFNVAGDILPAPGPGKRYVIYQFSVACRSGVGFPSWVIRSGTAGSYHVGSAAQGVELSAGAMSINWSGGNLPLWKTDANQSLRFIPSDTTARFAGALSYTIEDVG